MPQATPSRRRTCGRKVGLLGGLGVAAAALWHGQEAFVGGSHTGRQMPVVLCRAGSEIQEARPEWKPYVMPYVGNPTYRPTRDLQADKYREWWHIDAEGKLLNSVSNTASSLLRGKYNILNHPKRDMGAFVVVTNCELVRVPGKMYWEKLYYRNFAKRPGHGTIERFCDLQKRFPERILMRSIWEAMPKNPTTRRIFRERCKLFAGPNHLYYHYNPTEFPSHMIKDVTPSDNFKEQDRYETWVTQYWPRIVARRRRDAERKRIAEFKDFKGWMSEQFEVLKDDEAIKDMSLDEFAAYAEKLQAKRVREEAKGAPEPKKKVNYWPGTKIPKTKIIKNEPGNYYPQL